MPGKDGRGEGGEVFPGHLIAGVEEATEDGHVLEAIEEAPEHTFRPIPRGGLEAGLHLTSSGAAAKAVTHQGKPHAQKEHRQDLEPGPWGQLGKGRQVHQLNSS